MFVFLLILFIIIANSVNNEPNKRNQQNRRKTNYYAPNMTPRQRQDMFRRQQEQFLRQIAQQTRNNTYANPYNPYTRNSSNQGNPYTGMNSRLTNYGTPTMPNTAGYQQMTINSYGLPNAAAKRKKIVKKFNNKYGLNLTDRDIDQIVSSSYMSTAWSREICYMNQKYETIYSWFATSNPWLKAYLFAFPMQQVSSDFAMQEQIAYNAFDQVFSDVLSKPDITVSEAIWEINNRYYTQFDESTFMIAYRFMEQKGKKYRLNLDNVIKGSSDIDDLLSKYEQTQMPSH
ncbi:MAG: hypothetical protein J5872_06865 [Lachnospiraceae bacterium]|nr:hypothetical protein [Lachnospiraceae bacterium]